MGYFTPVNKDPSFFPNGLDNSCDKVPQIFGANNTESFGILSTMYQAKGFNDGLSEEDGKFFLKQFVQMAAPVSFFNFLLYQKRYPIIQVKKF